MLHFLSGEGGFDPLHVESGFIFWSFVTFAIVLAILYKVGWGPLTRTIEVCPPARHLADQRGAFVDEHVVA